MTSGDEVMRVNKGVVDLWAAASRDSEHVSQLLMGASVRLIQRKGEWVRVQGPDTYRGWMEARFLSMAAPCDALEVVGAFADVRVGPSDSAPLLVRLPGGANVEAAPARNGWCQVGFPDGVSGWVEAKCLDASVTPSDPMEAAVSCALSMVGTPYLWGGSSPFGFDCSGLVQFAYGRAGVVLRRDADQQRMDPRFTCVDTGDFARGDLLFFGREDRINHVAMALGDGRFVHAAGGDGTITTPCGDERFFPHFVDARRLAPKCRWDAVTRWEADDR